MKYDDFALLLMFLGCLPLCHGYATGPPIEVCESMMPLEHKAKAQSSEAPYNITASHFKYKKEDAIAVTIKATDPSNTPFKGFLIQARIFNSTDNLAVGTFLINDTDTEILLMSCTNGTNNTVSHTSSVDKTSKTFAWIADSGPELNITFQATIVNTKTTYWTDVQSEMVSTLDASQTSCSLQMFVFLAAAVLIMA